MKAIAVTVLFLICAVNALFGQTKVYQQGHGPFVLGVTDTINSVQLSEKRVLNIYLPDGYDTAKANYPVIYLLDGSANEDFVHIVGLVQFLTMTGAMQAPVVVGIGNVDRKRDFTFPTKNKEDKKNFPTTGGSAKFIAFLEKDLQPYVQSHYRVNEQKTIIGQSLGGLLATEILLKEPGLFNSYIIVSPSMWWDDESLLATAPALLKTDLDGDIKVYVSVGNEEKQMVDDADKLVNILHLSGDKRLHLNYVHMPEENHLTILHNCVYNALVALNKKQ